MSQVLLKNPYKEALDSDVMSNFDHTIDEAIATELRKRPTFASYPGWDFCGTVWYDKVKKTYHCEVWQYHTHVDTISGTLNEIMDEISTEYGYE